MKGDPKVLAALQAAINLEASVSAAYLLNGKILHQDLAIKTGKELKELGEQACKFKKMLIKHLRFLDGSPDVDADVASLGDNVEQVLTELLKAEMDIVAQYTDFTVTCWAAKDMENFHLFQHLIRWHRAGHSQYRGHIMYLEHELKQIEKLGETDYIASHI